MQVQITLSFDVGDTAQEDAVSYFIYQYGTCAEPNSPEEAVEGVVLDVLSQGDASEFEHTAKWTLLGSHVEVV